MSTLKKILSTATLALALPVAADAAVLDTITFNYGQAPNTNPIGNDVVRSDHVEIEDTTPGGLGSAFPRSFIQIFDFSSLAADTITSFELTLEYAEVDLREGPGMTPDNAGRTDIPAEAWSARILGTDNSSVTDDTFFALSEVLSSTPISTTFTIDAASDLSTGTSGFLESDTTNTMRLRFRELSELDDTFNLHSATLVVMGTPAAVPLPASGMLLLGAVGGAAMIRRRRKAA